MQTLAKRWISGIVALLCLFAPAQQAMAQADSSLAYESVEPSRIKVGDSALLRVTSFGRLKDITLPTIPGLIFEQLHRSQGLEFVNGSAIPASFIDIRVTAQFAGVFTIPGLTPTAQAIGLEVVKGDEPNPYAWKSQRPAPPPIVTASLPKGVQLQAGGAAFVHLSFPTRPIYVGESVPVDVELGLRAGIVTSVNGLPTLKGSDFTLNNLSKQPERREQSIDGGTFVVLTWHSTLAPVKPGVFALAAEAPVTAKISTLSAADRAVSSRLAFPLLQSMYSGVVPKEINIDSSPASLTVLALPSEGRPENFSGAVGDFQVASELTPASAAAGDPLTLRLHVSGAGNFDRVDSVMFAHLDHWKTYAAKSSFTPSDSIGYQGEKVFEQPLIASQSGEQSLPGLAFSYFNPNTRRYEQAQTSPIKVTITGSLAGGTVSIASATGITQGLRPDHPNASQTVNDLRPLYFRPPFLGVPATLALILAGAWIAVRPAAARTPSKAAERVLAQLAAAAQDGDVGAFFVTARTALLHNFAARWQIPVDQITGAQLRTGLGASGGEIERLFELADEVRYSDQRQGSTDFRYWLELIRAQLADGK